MVTQFKLISFSWIMYSVKVGPVLQGEYQILISRRDSVCCLFYALFSADRVQYTYLLNTYSSNFFPLAFHLYLHGLVDNSTYSHLTTDSKNV